jgi:hypothetical protein
VREELGTPFIGMSTFDTPILGWQGIMHVGDDELILAGSLSFSGEARFMVCRHIQKGQKVASGELLDYFPSVAKCPRQSAKIKA